VTVARPWNSIGDAAEAPLSVLLPPSHPSTSLMMVELSLRTR
jgi:hypothetical protein